MWDQRATRITLAIGISTRPRRLRIVDKGQCPSRRDVTVSQHVYLTDQKIDRNVLKVRLVAENEVGKKRNSRLPKIAKLAR